MGELRNLTWLDLSYNRISGSIPPELGLVNNVENINLAHNQLSGHAPSELGA